MPGKQLSQVHPGSELIDPMLARISSLYASRACSHCLASREARQGEFGLYRDVVRRIMLEDVVIDRDSFAGLALSVQQAATPNNAWLTRGESW